MRCENMSDSQSLFQWGIGTHICVNEIIIIGLLVSKPSAQPLIFDINETPENFDMQFGSGIKIYALRKCHFEFSFAK